MSDQTLNLPGVIGAGIHRKIKEAFDNPVDGHPASRGLPMETEVRHYYSSFLVIEEITLDAFLLHLSREIAPAFDGLELTLAWVRECDALNNVRTARNSLSKLLHTVHCGQQYGTSFWEILWRLKEVSLRSFGISYGEAGTSARELTFLSRQFLLHECRCRLSDLRTKSEYSNLAPARNAFILLDNMLDGIPIPHAEFCRNAKSHYAPSGPYALYCDIAEGRRISPDDIGWSWQEHDALRMLIFPDGYRECPRTANTSGPTPPTAIVATQPVAAVPETAEPNALHPRLESSQGAALPKALSDMITSTVQRLPGLPKPAVGTG